MYRKTTKIDIMEKKVWFIKVDPNNDTGNDDGILDREEMTQRDADIKNSDYRFAKIDLRWIKESQSNSSLSTNKGLED